MERIGLLIGYMVVGAMAILVGVALYETWRTRGGSLDDLPAAAIAEIVKEAQA